jgi:hypothetical protein
VTEPRDWYTAGKLLWALGQEREVPDKILIHPADRHRLLQRIRPHETGWDGQSVFGVPLETQLERPEHVAELVLPGHRWVPVIFDPIDFPEPIPLKVFPDGRALAEWRSRHVLTWSGTY